MCLYCSKQVGLLHCIIGLLHCIIEILNCLRQLHQLDTLLAEYSRGTVAGDVADNFLGYLEPAADDAGCASTVASLNAAMASFLDGKFAGCAR